MTLDKIKNEIYLAIGENVDKAFELLKKYLSNESDLYPIYLVKKGNWNTINKDILRGTVNKYSPEGITTINTIANSLVEITSKLTENDLVLNGESNLSNKEIKNKRKPESISSSIIKTLKKLEGGSIEEDYLPTGFSNLDKLIKGLRKKSLTVIAARPGMGIISFGLTTCLNIVKEYAKKVLYISFDSSSENLTSRLISIDTGINIHKIIKGKLIKDEWKQFEKSIENLNDLEFYIYDSCFSLEDALKIIKDNIEELKVDVIIIEPINFSKEVLSKEEPNKFIMELKEISNNNDVSIILQTHLMKNVETRSGIPRPKYSDLDEVNPVINFAADLVIYLWRPAYYHILEDEEGNDISKMAELIITKNKYGSGGDVKLEFNDKIATFRNWESD